MGTQYNEKWTNDQKIIDKFGLKIDKSIHNHLPENDAEYIYRLHTGVLNAVKAKNARVFNLHLGALTVIAVLYLVYKC
jgi:hypothetical protein